MSGLFQADTPGVVLAYRVDDIHAAVAKVGELSGTASPVAERPNGLSADSADNCVDDQGTVFHLLQLPT